MSRSTKDHTMQELIKQRNRVLLQLYQARRVEAGVLKTYTRQADIEDLVGDCQFNLDILVELRYIKQDGNRYRITAKGVLASEGIK